MKYRHAGKDFIITVYANSPSIELFCNGASLSKATETGEPTGVVWKFPVKMRETPTTFKAVSENGKTNEITILPLEINK